MAKKDFSKVNTERVYNTIEEATAEEKTLPKMPQKPRKTYTDKEALELMANMETTGRKGVKLPRMNMAFTPDNYAYIKTMSKVRGESLTQFVNHLIETSIEQNAEIYAKAIEFRKSL